MYGTSINLVEDICPVTEFRAEINSMIQKTKATHRPIVLTQHGKSTAVVIDIGDYQRMIEHTELAADIKLAQKQYEEGKTYSTTQAKERIMKRFKDVQG